MTRIAPISSPLRAALLAAAVLVAGCASGDRDRLVTVEVTGGQQRHVVDILDQGEGVRDITVRARSYRGLDRTEGGLAFQVAAQAGETIDCGGGKPLRVLPDSGLFIESDRSVGPIGRGEPVWRFKGRCGG